jgi:hypothetical protein
VRSDFSIWTLLIIRVGNDVAPARPFIGYSWNPPSKPSRDSYNDHGATLFLFIYRTTWLQNMCLQCLFGTVFRPNMVVFDQPLRDEHARFQATLEPITPNEVFINNFNVFPVIPIASPELDPGIAS